MTDSQAGPAKLERHAPAGFVFLGVAMIAGAAAGAAVGLHDAVAVALIAFGTGLVILGGFASRMAGGPVELTATGLKFMLADLSRVAAERDEPETAKKLEAAAEAVTDTAWFGDYLRQRQELGLSDPNSLAALLQHRYRTRRERGQ